MVVCRSGEWARVVGTEGLEGLTAGLRMTEGLYGLTAGGREVWPVVVVEGSIPVRGEAAQATLLRVLASMSASISASSGRCGLSSNRV